MVVLPAPFGPEETEYLALADVEGDVGDRDVRVRSSWSGARRESRVATPRLGSVRKACSYATLVCGGEYRYAFSEPSNELVSKSSVKQEGSTPGLTAAMSDPAAPDRTPRLAVYAGVFDPPTMAHLEIIESALRIFDELVVVVALQPEQVGRAVFARGSGAACSTRR